MYSFGIEDNLDTNLSRFSHFHLGSCIFPGNNNSTFLLGHEQIKQFLPNLPINLEIGNYFGQYRQDDFDGLFQLLHLERRIVTNCCFFHEHIQKLVTYNKFDH